MKSHKEFIQERLDDLALKYHNKFYCTLTKELQETLWNMANKDWGEYENNSKAQTLPQSSN